MIPLLTLVACGAGVPAGWTNCYRVPAHFAEDPKLWVPSSLAEEIGAGTDELPYIACDEYITCDEGSAYRGELYGYGNVIELDEVSPGHWESNTHDEEGQRLRCDACGTVNGAAMDFGPPGSYWPEDPFDTCGWNPNSPDDPSGYVTWTDDPEKALRDARNNP